MSYGILRLTGSATGLSIDQPSAIVGRAEGSPIRIDDPTVSRRHARLTVEGGHLTVEDLGSATGVYIDGSRIPAGTPVRVEPGQRIRFGDVEAAFEATDAGETSAPGRAPGGPGSAAPPQQLGVVLSPPALTIEPGSRALIEVRIRNQGSVIDSVSVEAEGVPESWIVDAGQTMNLQPGQDAIASVTIEPPRSPATGAGDHHVTVVVRSQATAASARATAVLTISPFAATSAQLQRQRGSFALTLANAGNSPASFNLDAADDEGVLEFEFSNPSVTVAPEGRETVDLSTHRPDRRWFGPQQTVPFRVTVRRTDMDVPVEELMAEHRSAAVLERYKWPGIILLALLLLFGLAGVVWALQKGGGGDGPAHASTATSEPSPGASPAAAGEPNPCDDRSLAAEVVPAGAIGSDELFTQKDSRWGALVYARADNPLDICGSTIAQCGCAMTSAVNVLRLFGNTLMPDGRQVTPQSVNEYFNRDAVRAGAGWQSRGYYHNGVNWFAVSELSAEIARTNPGTRRVVFVPQWGSGSEQQIRDEVSHGRPVILELYIRSATYTGPHFVTAVGLDGDRVVIKDPSYDEPRYLEGYLPFIQSSRLFRYADDGPAIEGTAVTVAANERIRIVDKDGNVIGTFEGDTPEEAIEKAKKEIPGAVITYQPAWRDATCSAQPSDAEGGLIEIFVPGSGELTVEPSGDEQQGCTVMVTHIAADGTASHEVFEKPDCEPFRLNEDQTAAESFMLSLTAEGEGTGSPSGGGTYAAGETVAVSPNPAPGSLFDSWSGPDAAECATGKVVLDADKSCTANYKKAPPQTQLFSLTLSRAGNGNGTLGGAGTYESGKVAAVSAVPAQGSRLTGWSGPNGAECATGRVTMTANKSCTATFQLQSYTLTILKDGSGSGTVSGAGTYAYGTPVSVSAAADGGSVFAGWSGPDGNECAGGSVSMTANKSCTATFNPEQQTIFYSLTMSINQASTGGGELTPPVGTYSYVAGTRVSVEPLPDAESTFSTFFGPNAAECRSRIVVMNADKQCDAIFTIPFVSKSQLSCQTSDRIKCSVSIEGDYNQLRWFINEGLVDTGPLQTDIDEPIPAGLGAGGTLTVSVKICNILTLHQVCKTQTVTGTIEIVGTTPIFKPL